MCLSYHSISCLLPFANVCFSLNICECFVLCVYLAILLTSLAVQRCLCIHTLCLTACEFVCGWQVYCVGPCWYVRSGRRVMNVTLHTHTHGESVCGGL